MPIGEQGRDAAAEGKSRWGLLVRIAVTILCFAALYAYIDPAELWAHLSRLTAGVLLIALALHSLIILLLAWRWSCIVRALGGVARFGLALRLTFVTAFFNLVLPLSIAGDLGRVWLARDAGVDLGTGIAAAVLDRIVGLVALGLLVMVGAMLLPDAFLPREGRLLLAGLLPAMLVGLWLLLVVARHGARRWPVMRRFAAMTDKAQSLLHRPRPLALVLGQSLLGHLFAVTCAVVIARGLHLELGFPDALLLFPVVLLASMLPFSVGGWGVREAAAISVFSFSGMSSGGALAISLLFGLTQVAVSGLGTLLLLGWARSTWNSARP